MGSYKVQALHARVDLKARGTLHSAKLQCYWSLTIRFFVSYLGHLWESNPSAEMYVVGVFYSPLNWAHVCIYVYYVYMLCMYVYMLYMYVYYKCIYVCKYEQNFVKVHRQTEFLYILRFSLFNVCCAWIIMNKLIALIKKEIMFKNEYFFFKINVFFTIGLVGFFI